MVARLVVQVERAAQRVAPGMEGEYQPHRDPTAQEPGTGLDGAHQRPSRQHDRRFPTRYGLQRPSPPREGVGIAGVRLRLETEERGQLDLPREIPEPDLAAGVDSNGDSAVADPAIERAHRAWRGTATGPAQGEPACLGCGDRHAHDLDLILVRVVSRGIQPVLLPAAAEDLERGASDDGGDVPIRGRSAFTRNSASRRAYQNITAEPAQVGYDDAAPGPRHGIPEEKLRADLVGRIAGRVGIVAGERMESLALERGGEGRGVLDPRQDAPGDGIGGASADRVVELGPEQRAPGRVEDRPPVATPPPPIERGQRLGQPLQTELRLRVPSLERRSGAMHTLQGPGVAVRPAKLSGQDGGRFEPVVPRGPEELVEAGDPNVGVRLQLRQRRPERFRIGVRRVVVGTDEHGHMPGPGPGPQHRTDCCPGRSQLRRVRGQRGAHLVAVGRQVVEPHLASGPIAPAEEVALLPRLAAESPPERAVLDVELGGQGRPRRGMTERVGRVEHVEPASQTSGVGGTGEQIADQRLARGDELVRQHVPGPDLQSAGPHQPPRRLPPAPDERGGSPRSGRSDRRAETIESPAPDRAVPGRRRARRQGGAGIRRG